MLFLVAFVLFAHSTISNIKRISKLLTLHASISFIFNANAVRSPFVSSLFRYICSICVRLQRGSFLALQNVVGDPRIGAVPCVSGGEDVPRNILTRNNLPHSNNNQTNMEINSDRTK